MNWYRRNLTVAVSTQISWRGVVVVAGNVWVDYVIHQGITIKGVGGGGLEGNSGAADDHRIATAQGQECFVLQCVRQVARRR